MIRPGYFSFRSVFFFFFNTDLVAKVASELANLFLFRLTTLHSMEVKCFISSYTVVL